MQMIRKRALLVTILSAVMTVAITMTVILFSAPSGRAAITDLLPPSLKAQIRKNIKDGNTLPVHLVSSPSISNSLTSTLVYSSSTSAVSTYGSDTLNS